MILVYMEGKFIDLSDLVHLKLDSVNVSWCSVIQYQYIFGSERSLRSANVVGHVSVGHVSVGHVSPLCSTALLKGPKSS